jgi:hypothetical protein
MIEYLSAKLTKNISQLSMKQKCEFLRSYRLVEDEIASTRQKGEIDFTTSV